MQVFLEESWTPEEKDEVAFSCLGEPFEVLESNLAEDKFTGKKGAYVQLFTKLSLLNQINWRHQDVVCTGKPAI